MILRPIADFGIDPDLHLASSLEEAEPQEGPPPRQVNRGLVSVEPQLQASLDELAGALHHTLCRSLGGDVDRGVVRLAERRERRALRGPLLARLLHSVRHDSRFQVSADQLEHALAGDLSCHPGHQRVVLDSTEEAIEVQIDGPLASIGDVALGAADRVMSAQGGSRSCAPRSWGRRRVPAPAAGPAGSGDPGPSAPPAPALLPRAGSWPSW